MDALTCRSPARCRACEWVLPSGACRLEADIAAALAPRERAAPVMLLVDARASA